MADEKDDKDDKQDDARFIAARRRLLMSAVYVPPVVLGIISLTQGCAPGSCAPATCVPAKSCHPNACAPHP